MELTIVGVSIAVFNQVSKIAIFLLVSVTASFVIEQMLLKVLVLKQMTMEYSRMVMLSIRRWNGNI